MRDKVRAGDPNFGQFNVPFTRRERHALRSIAELREQVKCLKSELRELSIHAHAPSRNHDPDDIEEFSEIDGAIDNLEAHIRWIPGGRYRFAADEEIP